ncbi:hypothetical protein NB703_003909 [Pantoea ananatis]|uniref:Uncharacterized protein n=1 Tax=Pantoea ananas TaxID=553 RepID=A0AAJ1D3N7_PANAN|nr:hypothetical protein [Pantoea ananatis]
MNTVNDVMSRLIFVRAIFQNLPGPVGVYQTTGFGRGENRNTGLHGDLFLTEFTGVFQRRPDEAVQLLLLTFACDRRAQRHLRPAQFGIARGQRLIAVTFVSNTDNAGCQSGRRLAE